MSGIGRLRWHCRRGMKELDVLLERWLDRHAPTASPVEIEAFETLLAMQDPQLARYLLAGEAHAVPSVQSLIERIRQG